MWERGLVCVRGEYVLWNRLQVEGAEKRRVLYLYCCASATGSVGAGGFTAAAPMTRSLTCTVTTAAAAAPSWGWSAGRRSDGTVTLIRGGWRALDSTEECGKCLLAILSLDGENVLHRVWLNSSSRWFSQKQQQAAQYIIALITVYVRRFARNRCLCKCCNYWVLQHKYCLNPTFRLWIHSHHLL